MSSPSPTVLLFGGSSEIGLAILHALVGPPPGRVVLAGRPGRALSAAAGRLAARGHPVRVEDYDTRFTASQVNAVLQRSAEVLDGIDIVVVAIGRLHLEHPDPSGSTEDGGLADLMRDNLSGPALAADAAVARLCHQGHGTVVVVTSAAAVRPRDRILRYSVAKRALDAFVIGLDRRARPLGVRCRVVRPGQVRTRMTAGLPDAPLTLDPHQVGERVRAGLRRRSPVIWAPSHMRAATALLRAVPRRVLPRELR